MEEIWARNQTYQVQNSDLQSIFFSSADNWSTRIPYWRTSPQRRRHKIYNFTPEKSTSSPVRSQSEQETTRWQFKSNNIEILRPEEKFNYFDQLIAIQKCRASQVWTPHQIRVINIHEPQTSRFHPRHVLRDRLKLFNVTVTPITPLRIRNVNDDWTNENEAPVNATTHDDDHHTDQETNRQTLRSCACRGRRCQCRRRNPTILTANMKTTRPNIATKTATSTKKAATATPASTKSQKKIQKTIQSRGSTTQNESNTQSVRNISSNDNLVMDSQTDPNLLDSDKIDCQAPRRSSDQVCLSLTGIQ